MQKLFLLFFYFRSCFVRAFNDHQIKKSIPKSQMLQNSKLLNFLLKFNMRKGFQLFKKIITKL